MTQARPMAKPQRSEGRKPRPKPAPAVDERLSPVILPNPPKRRPLFLLAAAVAMALWLLFLLWMALA
jgi:hypothetical protein